MQGSADYPFEFQCRRSGNCCSIPGGFVTVTAEEITAMADHLGLSEAAMRCRFVTPGGDRLVEGMSSRCVLLASVRETATSPPEAADRPQPEAGLRQVQTSCRVYPVRPAKCRTWPYWPELRGNPDGLRRAAARCPGIELGDEPEHS